MIYIPDDNLLLFFRYADKKMLLRTYAQNPSQSLQKTKSERDTPWPQPAVDACTID
jgi:hypothetical protein